MTSILKYATNNMYAKWAEDNSYCPFFYATVALEGTHQRITKSYITSKNFSMQ